MFSRILPRVLVLSLLLLTFLGCAREAPKVASVTLTDQVDATTKAAKTALSNFPAGTKLMYASVQVTSPRKGTQVRAEWFYDREGKGNYLRVDDATITFDQNSRDRYAAFSLKAVDVFPNGAYKLAVYLDDKPAQEIKFNVQ